MIYLERNAEIIAEINRSASLTRGKEIGSSSKTFTFSVGLYESVLLGTSVHMALKERPRRRRMDLVEEVQGALVVAALVFENIPEIRAELPLFIGTVTDEKGEPLGELTEDFTRGGQYRISDLFADEVARDSSAQEIRELIGGEYSGSPYLLEDGELVHCFFRILTEVGHSHRRVGDFDTAWMHMTNWGNRHRDLEKTIGEDMSRYTVRSGLKAKYRDY